MPVTFEKVARDIRRLPRRERDRLLTILLHDLDDEPESDTQDLREAWGQEVSRRLADIDTGRVKPISADKAFAALRRKRRDAR